MVPNQPTSVLRAEELNEDLQISLCSSTQLQLSNLSYVISCRVPNDVNTMNTLERFDLFSSYVTSSY